MLLLPIVDNRTFCGTNRYTSVSKVLLMIAVKVLLVVTATPKFGKVGSIAVETRSAAAFRTEIDLVKVDDAMA